MTVQVNPVEKKDSGLKDILSALDVAADKIYGVKIDADKADALIEQNKLRASAEDEKNNLTAIQHINETQEVVPVGTAGSVDRANLKIPRGFNLPEDKTLRPRTAANLEFDKSKTNFSNHNTIRDEYNKKSEVASTGISGYSQLESLADAPSTGPQNMGVLYGFLKTIDPRAIVTDADAENVIKSGGVSPMVMNYYNRITEGKLFTNEQIGELKETARLALAGKLKAQKEIDHSYEDFANRAGLDKNLILDPRFKAMNDQFAKIEKHQSKDPFGNKISKTNTAPDASIEARRSAVDAEIARRIEQAKQGTASK